MMWPTKRIQTIGGNDAGVSLILVLGMTVVISSLVATASIMTMNTLGQSTSRTLYEQSLASAEQGIDATLARLQWAFDYYNADYPVPGAPTAQITSPDCVGTAVAYPGPFEDGVAEEAWARSELQAIAAAHPECIRTGTDGQYLVLKPATPEVGGAYPGFGTVYSMGWSPERGAARATERLVKAEYVFLPYEPQHAILAAEDLELDSSTLVTTASGYSPDLAGVHSNTTITTNGNPTVYGPVSSSGSSAATSNRFYGNPGGTVTQEPTVSIPHVSALRYYYHAASIAQSVSWWDLCPNGTVRRYSGDGPCTGTTVAGGPSAIGWSFQSGSRTWVAGRNSVNGAFYVHEGNVDVGTGNTSIANITVIASASNADDCATKRYGNITWDHYDMEAPAIPNLFLFADSDIATHSNFTAGNRGINGSAVVSGMFIAGDQISLQTSSQGAVGSVLSAGQCATADGLVTANSVKNPEVFYDPTGDSPFTSIIRVTLWLEY